MKCYLSSCLTGFIVLDENCNLLDYELFPRDRLVEKLETMHSGNLTTEEEALLKRMVKKCDQVVIETTIPHSKYKSLKKNVKFKFKTPHKAGEFLRSQLAAVLQEVGFIETEEELLTVLHELSLEITEQKLKEASKTEDMLLIQAINAIDEVDETTGKLVERLREWHSIHFPEIDKIKSHEFYVQLVADYGMRDPIISSGLLDPDINTAKNLGVELNEPDALVLQEFASSIRSLQKSKKSLTEYVDQKIGVIAPNLRDLAGPSLGAKMISHVGGIKKLAMLPSGTVQVLGAEKALFRHLKTGERPPKHGLIYQHPQVRGAKWWVRGKISRSLASKISLAVRKDFFSGEYDPRIKEQFIEKVKEIEKANPFPKRATKPQKSDLGKKKKKKKKKDKYRDNFRDYY